MPQTRDWQWSRQRTPPPVTVTYVDLAAVVEENRGFILALRGWGGRRDAGR